MTSMLRFVAVGIVIVVGLAMAVHGEDSGKPKPPNPEVGKLAHEGYWLKDKDEVFKPAMEMLGKPAPALNLIDWYGEAASGDLQKGKIVLIDFWATWDTSCIAQIPNTNEICKKYADKGVLVFGACCPRGSDKMESVAGDKKMEYSTGRLNEDDAKSWKIAFWPTYAVIDRKGQLRAIGLKPEYVGKVLDALLEEQPEQENDRWVEHESSTIVYLCNSAGSMADKMPTLKSELSRSISHLKANQTFDIIFYQDAKVERFQPGFVGVGADNRRKAAAYLEGITAKGENNPALAMTAALKLKPGLVYFLTDGADFKDPAALQAVIKKYNADKDANGKPKIKINTILFIKDKAEHEKIADSEGLMHQIASDNGGNFRWVELDNIP